MCALLPVTFTIATFSVIKCSEDYTKSINCQSNKAFNVVIENPHTLEYNEQMGDVWLPRINYWAHESES